jgi:hypothetical protein
MAKWSTRISNDSTVSSTVALTPTVTSVVSRGGGSWTAWAWAALVGRNSVKK